jgi:hypothetical protein
MLLARLPTLPSPSVPLLLDMCHSRGVAPSPRDLRCYALPELAAMSTEERCNSRTVHVILAQRLTPPVIHDAVRMQLRYLAFIRISTLLVPVPHRHAFSRHRQPL